MDAATLSASVTFQSLLIKETIEGIRASKSLDEVNALLDTLDKQLAALMQVAQMAKECDSA